VSLQSDIAARLAPWADLLVTVVRNNPSGDIYDMLSRPDISGLLETGLAEARARAENALTTGWPSGASLYRASLMADIARLYATAEGTLRDAALEGFRLVPQAVFVPGVSAPGSNPGMESAQRRAQEVQRRVVSAIWRLGLRNSLTASVAPVRRRGEAVLADAAEAGHEWMVKWVCRKGPDGRPDARVCHWCRLLDAMGPIPIGSEFPVGDPVGGMRPPRVYFNLRCPPRHPHCRCRIILVRVGGGRDAEVGVGQATASPALFISADYIRAMPAARYDALADFHSAALHELGQVIRHHRQGRA
jgi:hypothetical protein